MTKPTGCPHCGAERVYKIGGKRAYSCGTILCESYVLQSADCELHVLRAKAAQQNPILQDAAKDTIAMDAIRLLADHWKDLHIEYHEHEGWQVSTCYADGSWVPDSWVRADGSLLAALLKAVEKTRHEKTAGETNPDSALHAGSTCPQVDHGRQSVISDGGC